MKKFLVAGLLIPVVLLCGEAFASDQSVARQLIDLTHASPREVAPMRRSLDPAKREAHFRKVAATFYAKKLSRQELDEILAFFRSAAGRRLLKTEDQIEAEVLIAAFSEIITPDPSASPAPAVPEGEPVVNQRAELALKLMKTPGFERRLEGWAEQYDRTRAQMGTPDVRTSKTSIEHIRQLFVDRYSKRFGKGLLSSLVEFYSSDLGVKYARVGEELERNLIKEAKRYDAAG